MHSNNMRSTSPASPTAHQDYTGTPRQSEGHPCRLQPVMLHHNDILTTFACHPSPPESEIDVHMIPILPFDLYIYIFVLASFGYALATNNSFLSP